MQRARDSSAKTIFVGNVFEYILFFTLVKEGSSGGYVCSPTDVDAQT
jgi:hypothetical protein